jgi:transposase
MQFLRSVELDLLERKLLDGQLELLEELRTLLSLVESILVQFKENDEIVEGLKTIPGIGEFFTMLIRYEMDEIERFPTSNKL